MAHPICILEREEVGRYLCTTQVVRQGDLLWSEAPLFLSPRPPELQELFTRLFDEGEGARASKDMPVATQLFLCVLQEMVDQPESDRMRALQELRGHDTWQEHWAHLWALLRSEHRDRLDEEAARTAFAKVAANSHETQDKRAALCIMGSLAEHSCAPSAFKEVGKSSATVADGGSPLLELRALRDMAEGEIVSISYIPEYNPLWRRQHLLRTGYNFDCHCARCTGSVPELVCAFNCPECGGGPCCPMAPCVKLGALGSLQCDDCGCIVTSAEVIAELAAAESCETFCGACAPFLHPYHFKIFQMYMGNLEAVSPEQCIAILEQLVDAYERFSQNERHPFIGKLLELTAKKRRAAGDAAEAAEEFRRAAAVYAVSHGPASAHRARCEAAAEAAEFEAKQGS